MVDMLLELSDKWDELELISGGADGADKWAEKCANAAKLPIIVVKPNWAKYGKRAGILRNEEMLDMEPNEVWAFWDGESRGTKHTITEAKRRGIETKVIMYNEIVSSN